MPEADIGQGGRFEIASRNELIDVAESNRVAFILISVNDGEEINVGKYCRGGTKRGRAWK